MTVRHHPWIDLIPIPRLRDNILRTIQHGTHDNTPLAMDILDVRDMRSEAACLIVWGESWDPDGWEVAPLTMLTSSNLTTCYFSSMLTQVGLASQSHISRSTLFVAERLGRRFLALLSLGLCSIIFYLLTGLTAKFGNLHNLAGTCGTVACIFLFPGAYSFVITPLIAMYVPEVLPYNIRANGIAMQGILLNSC